MKDKVDRYFTKVGDDMTWPSYSESISDLGWWLRYSEEITDKDKMLAASVVSAYLQMIGDTQKKRNYVCKCLQEDFKKSNEELNEDRK